MTRREWIEYVQLGLASMATSAAQAQDYDLATKLMGAAGVLESPLSEMGSLGLDEVEFTPPAVPK